MVWGLRSPGKSSSEIRIKHCRNVTLLNTNMLSRRFCAHIIVNAICKFKARELNSKHLNGGGGGGKIRVIGVPVDVLYTALHIYTLGY